MPTSPSSPVLWFSSCVNVTWLHWTQSKDPKWNETLMLTYPRRTKLFQVWEKGGGDSTWSLVEDTWSICGNSEKCLRLYDRSTSLTPCHRTSDVKFHEIFCLEIFHEIFHEIFQKLHDVFFRLHNHPFNIFYTSNITFHSFMHTAAP